MKLYRTREIAFNRKENPTESAHIENKVSDIFEMSDTYTRLNTAFSFIFYAFLN